MDPNNLNANELEAIRLHVAGATVRHQSPFSELKSFRNEVEITQDFRNEWVAPFYLLNLGD